MDALKVIEGGNVDALMADLGRRARVAARRVALASEPAQSDGCPSDPRRNSTGEPRSGSPS